MIIPMLHKYSSCQRKGKKKKQKTGSMCFRPRINIYTKSVLCENKQVELWWLIENRMIRKNGPLDKREWARSIDRKVQTKEPLYSLDFWSAHTREEQHSMTRIVGDERELIPLVLVFFSPTVQFNCCHFLIGERGKYVKRGCSTSRASISTLSRVNFGNCRYSITVGWGGRATGTRPTHPPHPAFFNRNECVYSSKADRDE